MSELQIGVIHEGDTDLVVIEAALNAFLQRTFVLTSIQPERSLAFSGFGPRGAGWGGIYKWCREMVSMGISPAINPALDHFDLIILHIDADVAEKKYADILPQNPQPAFMPPNQDLPLDCKCPPAQPCVDALRTVVAGWLNLNWPTGWPAKWVFCTPSQSLEAWVIAARFDQADYQKLQPLECTDSKTLETWLEQRPKKQRLRKKRRDYQALASELTGQWTQAKTSCSQALRFETELSSVCP